MRRPTTTALALLPLVLACGDSQEAILLERPVVADARRLEPVVTDLGYEITIDRARLALRDLELTLEGEEHAALPSSALAHPGHGAGGEVAGELLGPFLLDWGEGAPAIGTASLLTGRYGGANAYFRRADDGDGLPPGDPLLGHSAHIEARVARGDERWSLAILLDLDDGAELLGVPFAHEITEADAREIGIQLAPVEPSAGVTLFDGLDVADLAGAETGAVTIAPGEAAHNQLRRRVGAHDHYVVELR